MLESQPNRVIITVCGDPGGARALVPVLNLLKKNSHIQLINYAYYQAIDILHQHQIEFLPLINSVSEEVSLRILKNDQINLLITATSVNDKEWEKYFISSARQLNIFSLSILDFWSNYALRFLDKTGKLNCLPDIITVMDNYAKNEIISENIISSERIMVTGQPALDDLHEIREQFSLKMKRVIRSHFKVKKNEKLIFFASQPLKKYYENQLGYHEISILNSLIRVLEEIKISTQQHLTLVIRPHPQESTEDYQYYSEHINIIVSAECNQREIAMASDLVLGMTSILLVEACYLHCIVLSLQLGLSKPDVLPTNRWGVSVPIYDEKEMHPIIKKYLFNIEERKKLLDKTLPRTESASQRIADYVLTQIKAFH